LINLYILVLNEASIYNKRGKTRILQTFGDDIALPAPTLLFDNKRVFAVYHSQETRKS